MNEQLSLIHTFDPANEYDDDTFFPNQVDEAEPITLIDNEVELAGWSETFNPPKIDDYEDAELSVKVALAVSALMTVLKLGKTLVVACSFGKDSSVALYLTLEALKQAKSEGIQHPTAFLMHSDTGIENPEIEMYAKGEIKKLEQYISTNELNMRVIIARPNLTNNYLVQMIGGRLTASLPGMDAKCQSHLKAVPLKSAKQRIKQIYAEEQGISVRKTLTDQIITIIGNRFDESAARSAKMRERSESATVPTLIDKNGEKSWVLSAIADWSAFDVFELIGQVVNSRLSTYSDFNDLMRVYRDASGECMVNLHLQGKGESKTSCGARHGCAYCLRVSVDSSMEQLITQDKYAYMKGLNDIRNYMEASHFDPKKRSWIPRTINAETGHIILSPNTYAPEYCLELLRYVITQDALEYERTYGAPRFQHMPLTSAIAVDLLNARYGYLTPYTALKTYQDIWDKGERYYPPTNPEKYKRHSFPKGISIPFADQFFNDVLSGFRDVMTNLGGDDLLSHQDSKGNLYFKANTSNSFSIDEEGAWLFYDFELDRHANRLTNYNSQPSTAMFTYLRYGFVSIARGRHSEWDRILRLSNQIFRHGISQDELSDPLAVIKKVCDNLLLSEAQIEAINEQILSKQFSTYYKVHYGKAPERILVKPKCRESRKVVTLDVKTEQPQPTTDSAISWF